MSMKTVHWYPPITIKRLTLHNIKCFRHVELSFEKEQQEHSWTVLVGDNGVGKTTILHCIALCTLGPELASKIIPIPRNVLRVGTKKGYMEAVLEAPLNPAKDNRVTEEVVIRLTIEKVSRTFGIEMDGKARNAKLIKEFIDARKRTDFEGWFVAGYGAVRNLLFTDEPSKIAQQDPVIDRVESLFDPTKLLIDPASLYRFLSGDTSLFKEMGAPAKLNPRTTRNIRNLLDKLLPMISFHEANGTGNLETPFGKVPISELSEGYKSMLSWLAHLIMHLLAAVQWNGDINDIKGIVLIDEVDLHLHPEWQQKVIPWLQESFPNLQFIGCTHSPMTAGGTDDGDIILLEQQEEDIIIMQDLPSIKGWRADQILTGPLFGLESSRDLATRQLLDEYMELKGLPELSPEKEKRLQRLEADLSENIPSSGETEIEREAFRLIEDTMEAYLNKQPPEKKERLLNEIKRQLKR
jgi:predicted ATP-binding protein involved in virulence